MRLTHLKISKLHGFLEIDLPLFDDLTIVVGANGSGKTSALSLISAFLRLDVGAVREILFKSATLKAVDEVGGDVVLFAVNDGEEQRIELTWKNVTHNLLALGGMDDPFQVGGGETFSYLFSAAQRNTNKKQITEMVEAARAFLGRSKLTFVQLDRSIVTIDADGTEALEVRPLIKRASNKATATKEPIEEVMRVTKQKYLEYRNELSKIKDDAYLESLQLHFAPINPALQDKKMDKNGFKSQLTSLRERVAKSGLTSDQSELKRVAERFFSEFQALVDASIKKSTTKRAGRRTLDDEQLEAILNLKQLQIEKLLTVFENEAKKTQEAYAPIGNYLQLADAFFAESGKRLVFDSNFDLTFVMRSKNTEFIGPSNRNRNLKELSSGERQILVILTYLAFVSGQKSIFVIDEPELSLHLVWQSQLIEALKSLRPEHCQIILATHAPEIAGRALEKCIQLGRSE